MIEFLRKYQEELISQKIELKEEIDFVSTKILEEQKFIEVLSSSNESYFNEFTPRDVNKKNNDKIAEVNLTIDELNSRLDDLTEKEIFVVERLEEVKGVITEFHEMSMKLKATDDNKLISSADSSNGDSANTDSSIKNKTDSNPNMNNDNSYVYNELKNIKSYISMDPQRAILAIDNLQKLFS